MFFPHFFPVFMVSHLKQFMSRLQRNSKHQIMMGIWLCLESPVWSQSPLSYAQTKHIMQLWHQRLYSWSRIYYCQTLSKGQQFLQEQIFDIKGFGSGFLYYNYKLYFCEKPLCNMDPQEYICKGLKLRLKRWKKLKGDKCYQQLFFLFSFV